MPCWEEQRRQAGRCQAVCCQAGWRLRQLAQDSWHFLNWNPSKGCTVRGATWGARGTPRRASAAWAIPFSQRPPSFSSSPLSLPLPPPPAPPQSHPPPLAAPRLMAPLPLLATLGITGSWSPRSQPLPRLPRPPAAPSPPGPLKDQNSAAAPARAPGQRAGGAWLGRGVSPKVCLAIYYDSRPQIGHSAGGPRKRNSYQESLYQEFSTRNSVSGNSLPGSLTRSILPFSF